MTLKKYLEATKDSLYAEIVDLQDFIEENGSSKNEEKLMTELTAKLSIIKSVINICQERGRY